MLSGCGVFSKKPLHVVGHFMAKGFRAWLSWTFVHSLMVLTKLSLSPLKQTRMDAVVCS